MRRRKSQAASVPSRTRVNSSRTASRIDSDSPPKKGLITDLDDTLWAGILGEIGVEGISWDMANRAHVHGLYQQFLSSLASAGVLLAVASKNRPRARRTGTGAQ